jgi:dipeptidyl aminopeptidase/acylaminoacyl peptidase
MRPGHLQLSNKLLLAVPLMAAALLCGVSPTRADAQQRPTRGVTITDPERARQLFVSNRPEDHPVANYEAHIRAKAQTDSIFEAVARGVMDYKKVSYRSRIGDMDIPAYVFQPLQKNGKAAHAAMIWVHGGVHGNWTTNYWPFIREAVERGYVIIAPEYRGSTGYGKEHHNAIDYGGYEVDDAVTAYDWAVANLPHVDPQRVGIMGWSHGGYISLLAVMRGEHPFKAAAAIVPVTNLIFRLSYKGPSYQRSFATQERLRGLPFESRAEYVERSPFYHVDKLEVPLLVHVATNDTDVDFEEASMLIWALRAQKPDLAETKIYTDPTPGPTSGGHTFSRRVNMQTLERDDSPEQRDSWNRVWTFMEWNLRPYLTGATTTAAAGRE